MNVRGPFVILILSSLAYGRELLYIQSLKAPIFQNPKLGSKEVAILKKGDKVTSIGKSDGWYRVTHGNVEGWIPSLLVSKEPPLERISITEREVDVKDTARRRASGYTTAAAVRGLLEDRYRANQKYMLDLESIEWLESLNISKEKTIEFEEGRD
ncbi:MAG: SH3 domain-containing protein [Hydrogenothermaceae bacterium]|nr:SH3 domain-containing protein [Hydrogenothermaceae bacterium]